MLSPEDVAELHTFSREKCHEFYEAWWEHGWEAIADLGRKDRFFLLTWLCGRKDADRDWIFQRCREVEKAPDDHLDLWAREHYKSTVITFAGIIQEVLRNPEITVGIFSHNRPTAKKFLTQIKHELETNIKLRSAYPDVLYMQPGKEAPRWSEEKGIIVKRKQNPKEATVEAHGLVEGMPVGAHYKLRVYDDVVTEDSVTSPEMMDKTINAWRLSQNLGSEGGRKWHIGTRYHFNDAYRTMLDDEILEPRIYPATDDGTPSGNPVLFTQEAIADKRKTQGPYIFACQQLLNPVADDVQGFNREWIRYHDGIEKGDWLNKYLLVDPANEKKKTSDYTAFFVVGLGPDGNYYILDIIRDRLNLTERWTKLHSLHMKWKPLGVGYEKYGKDSDIQFFELKMRELNYRFHIFALGGQTRKEDRIRKLVPLFETSKMWFPEYLSYNDYEGKQHDLVKEFVEQEYMGFPVALHDDMLDCLARIVDPDFPVSWPQGKIEDEKLDRYALAAKRQRGTRTWMSA